MKKLLAPLILLLIGLFAVKTFFGQGYFDGHDAQAHLVRLYQFDLALKDGQFLPAWAGDLYGGKGYPVFIFAYPLPYLIAEGFHLIGFSLQAAIKATFIISYLFAGLTIYWFGLVYWRSRLSAFIAAMVWMWAPYMFVKMFITASLGALVSYIFVPLTFLWLYRLLTRNKSADVIWLAVSLAGIILSHLITLVIFAPLMVIFALSNKGLKKIKPLTVSGLLALGLSAFYLLPALLELGFTHYRDFIQHQYADQFVTLSRLLYSKWGTDAPGWGNNPLSQQVGMAQWLAAGLAVIFGWRQKKLLPVFIGFALAIFLMLPVSKFIWDLPTPLQSVGTPWRFLSLAIFTAAVLAGYLATVKIKWRYLLLAVLVVLALYGNRNHIRINERVDYSNEWLQSYTGVATGWNEHLPIWVKEVDFSRPIDQPPPGQLNTLYYPGWQVKIDGKKVPIWPSTNGLIEFATPSAGAKIEAKFVKTPLRKAAYFLSLLTILVTAWITSSRSRKLM